MKSIFFVLLSVLTIQNSFAQSIPPANNNSFEIGFSNQFQKSMRELDSLQVVLSTENNIDSPSNESQLAKSVLQLHALRSVFYPYGDFKDAIASENSWQDYRLTSGNCDKGNWEIEGPVGDPVEAVLNSNRNGRLDGLAFEPTDPKIMYVCSGAGGGLWKFNANSNQSISMNTDKIPFHNGVGAVDAIPGRVIISTGNSFVDMCGSMDAEASTSLTTMDKAGSVQL